MVNDWESVSTTIWYYNMPNNYFYRMFFSKCYAQASAAFLRAGRKREAEICDAYLLRDKAQLVSTTTSNTRKQAFMTAANAFTTCAQGSPSKQVNERLAYYRTAGECYSQAHDLKNAGDSYQMANQYTAAACAYQKGGHFDKLLGVIIQHGDVLDSGLVEGLTTATQLYYFKVNFSQSVASECF